MLVEPADLPQFRELEITSVRCGVRAVLQSIAKFAVVLHLTGVCGHPMKQIVHMHGAGDRHLIRFRVANHEPVSDSVKAMASS